MQWYIEALNNDANARIFEFISSYELVGEGTINTSVGPVKAIPCTEAEADRVYEDDRSRRIVRRYFRTTRTGSIVLVPREEMAERHRLCAA